MVHFSPVVDYLLSVPSIQLFYAPLLQLFLLFNIFDTLVIIGLLCNGYILDMLCY